MDEDTNWLLKPVYDARTTPYTVMMETIDSVLQRNVDCKLFVTGDNCIVMSQLMHTKRWQLCQCVVTASRIPVITALS